MKSIFFTFIVFVTIITINQAQTLPVFRGKVKTITETSYNSTNQKIGIIVSKYNPQGFIIEHNETDVINNYVKSYFYTYDSHNKLVKLISKNFRGIADIQKWEYNDMGKVTMYLQLKVDSSLMQKYMYEYNDKGKILKFIAIYADSTLNYSKISTYDEKGNIIKEQNIPKSNFDETYSYIYDSRDSIIEQKTFNNKGKLVGKTTNMFDNQGQLLTKSHEYDSYYYGETIPAKQINTYNLKGNITEMKLCYGDPLILKYTTQFTYDSNDRKILTVGGTDSLTWKYNTKGILVNYTSCQNKNCISTLYNDFGDVIFDRDTNRIPSNYKYEYDSKNNWTVRFYTNKVMSVKTVRVYEYY